MLFLDRFLARCDRRILRAVYLLAILLYERVGIQMEKLRIIADKALHIHFAGQRFLIAFLDRLYVKGANTRLILNVFDRQTLFLPFRL